MTTTNLTWMTVMDGDNLDEEWKAMVEEAMSGKWESVQIPSPLSLVPDPDLGYGGNLSVMCTVCDTDNGWRLVNEYEYESKCWSRVTSLSNLLLIPPFPFPCAQDCVIRWSQSCMSSRLSLWSDVCGNELRRLQQVMTSELQWRRCFHSCYLPHQQDIKHHVNAIIDDDFWQVVKQEKLLEGDFEVKSSMSFGGSHWCRSMPDLEQQSADVKQNRSTAIPEHRSTTLTESTASCNVVKIMTHEEFAAKHPHPPSPVYVKIDRQTGPAIDRQRETAIDRQPPAPIDRRAPLTYQVQMPKIDVARLNVLRPQPKPSANRHETTSTHSADAAEPMEVDTAPMGRTLRKRKGKVAKHLLWMFFRETEEDIRRMFCEAREKKKNRITLKKKSDPEKFAIPCTVKGIEFPHALCNTGASVSILPRVMADHLGLKVEPSKESFTFVDCSQRSSEGIVRDLEESLLVNSRSSVQHANQPVVSDAHRPHVYYDLIPVMKPQMSSRRIDDPGLIAACHCGAEYKTEYSASIETHTATSIDSANQKSIDISKEESIGSSPGDWENDYYNPTMVMHTSTMHIEEYDDDYEEEQAIEYIAILAGEDRLLHHSSWKRNATSIDRTVLTSIDTHLHQASCKRAWADISYYPSIDTGVDRVREGDYSIGNWADDHYHESYAVETVVHERGVDDPHEGFTYEELLNYQKRSDTDSLFAQACGRGTHFYRPFNSAKRPSIDITTSTLIDIHSQPPSAEREKAKLNNNYLTPDEFGIFRDPDIYARTMDGHELQVSREDIAEILQMANGAENLFIQQLNSPTHQQMVTNEFYDTAGGVDDRFKPKYQQHTQPSIDIDVLTSIDRRPEFGKRAYDRDGTRRFH
ncbi:hypothetical protein F2Q69_00047947 [Brassica cretica]|uniref:Uncharacterized protein n=1 Tax=Brassica cretica TaxID=69181 RepID=A0A8S9PI67_BRACR|nr:hypothetical protein F2Q69_00047947 [Brassica cretica]